MNFFLFFFSFFWSFMNFFLSRGNAHAYISYFG